MGTFLLGWGRSDSEEVEKGAGLTLGVGIGELKMGAWGRDRVSGEGSTRREAREGRGYCLANELMQLRCLNGFVKIETCLKADPVYGRQRDTKTSAI